MSKHPRRQSRAQSSGRARTSRSKRNAASRRRWPKWIVGLAVVSAVAGIAFLARSPSIDPVLPVDSARFSTQLRQVMDALIAEVSAHGGDASAHGDLGLFYSENGYYREAIACFSNAESLDHEGLVWPFRKAMAMRETGDTKEAAAVLADLAERPGAFPAIYFELGVVRAADADLEHATVLFEKAAEQAPNRPEPLVALADLYNRDNRFEKARSLSEAALKLDPQYAAAHYQFGLALRGVGDRDAAKREMQLGLGAESRSLPDPLSQRSIELGISRIGRINRAIMLCEKGDLAGSEQILSKLATEMPDDVTVMNNLAAVLIQSKRHSDAMTILTKVVASDDRLFGPFINLSYCSLQLGRYSDAIVYARDAVARGTHVSQCHIALGDALSMAKDVDGALQAYSRAHELAPTNAQVLVVMARLCRQSGRFDESIRYLQDAAALQPNSFVVHASLCAVALEHGAIETAVHAFARADKLNPNDPQTTALRQRLQMARRQ